MCNNYWTTKDGRKILVNDLSNSHLVNILRFLKRNDNLNYPWLEKEAEKRNLKWESFHLLTYCNNLKFKFRQIYDKIWRIVARRFR